MIPLWSHICILKDRGPCVNAVASPSNENHATTSLPVSTIHFVALVSTTITICHRSTLRWIEMSMCVVSGGSSCIEMSMRVVSGGSSSIGEKKMEMKSRKLYF